VDPYSVAREQLQGSRAAQQWYRVGPTFDADLLAVAERERVALLLAVADRVAVRLPLALVVCRLEAAWLAR
jgi:hypothetical protein